MARPPWTPTIRNRCHSRRRRVGRLLRKQGANPPVVKQVGALRAGGFIARETAELQIGGKAFRVALKENARGQFLRITEDGLRKNTIIIPATGLQELCEVLKAMGQGYAKPSVRSDALTSGS